MSSYTYDPYGKLLTTTGTLASTIGEINPIRYRGYYYDGETGFYLTGTRYYDPEIGRFINADGYVSTGQGITGYNMYAYCGNNPISRMDPTGQAWWEIALTCLGVAAVAAITVIAAPALAAAGVAAATVSAVTAGAAMIATAATAVGVGASFMAATETATIVSSPSLSFSKSQSKAEENSGDVVISTPSSPQSQAYFTVNPNEFTPKGLVMTEYAGTKNGRIIEWRDPISHAKIFEWNEDLKNGSHYHAMMIEWDGDHHGTHYLPGSAVPEPWNTIYFGG